jgi:hypothetical protein
MPLIGVIAAGWHRSFWDNDVRINDVHSQHLFSGFDFDLPWQIPAPASAMF